MTHPDNNEFVAWVFRYFCLIFDFFLCICSHLKTCKIKMVRGIKEEKQRLNDCIQNISTKKKMCNYISAQHLASTNEFDFAILMHWTQVMQETNRSSKDPLLYL